MTWLMPVREFIHKCAAWLEDSTEYTADLAFPYDGQDRFATLAALDLFA